MRQVTVFCAVAVMVINGAATTDYTAIPISTGFGGQNPAISGDWVVWHDSRNGTENNDIYGYIACEPNEVWLCGVGGNQYHASVSGNVVVWQDERSSQMDIRAFDLVAREPLVLPNMPLGDNINQRYPKLSGSLILYEENTGGGVYNLFVYDMATSVSKQVSAAAVSQLNGAINGTIVAWVENHGGINRVYWRDVDTFNPAARVSQSVKAQHFPAVGGGLILWVEDAGFGHGNDIYGYDLVSGQVSVIVGGAGTQNRPAISGSIVVYQDRLGSSGNFDIRALDIDDGTTYPISVNSAYNDQLPVISGRRIAWQRGVGTAASIYMAEIPAVTAISVAAPEAEQMFLAGTEMEIAWYLIEGDAPSTVKIEFSTDNGVNWQPVAAGVPFEEGYYLWSPIADVDSQQCRVRVGDMIAIAMTEAFTVFRCDAALTADVTGDCRVDIADFAIFAEQWLACGNPYDPDWCWSN